MQIVISAELQVKIASVNSLRDVIRDLSDHLRRLEMQSCSIQAWRVADAKLEEARSEYQALYREVCRELAVAAGIKL